APTAKFAPTRRAAALSSPLAEVDRLAVVQTGPGVPSWQWTHIPLGWSGPVLRGQTLHLYLLSPGMARALAFLRVLLLAWLALKLFQSVTRILPPLRRGAASTALILAALLVPGLARAADEPSDARLDELRTRLLAPPRCAPSCAAVSRLFLEVDGDRLRLRLEVAAAATATLPLPGSATQWLPEQVVLDGHGPPPLRREQGRLVLAVSPGVHQVLLEGRLPQRESVQLSLGLVPGHAQARVPGWKVDGIHEDGRADDTLQLTRLTGKEGAAGADLRPGAMPPFVRVHRHLRFGLAWEVETTVARLSAPGSAAVLEVPLIAGEAVNMPEVRVVEGRVQVNLPPQAQSTGWHSTLEPRELVALTAPASGAWVEEWTLELGSMWHVVLSGIPPLYPSEPELFHRPTWEPWPGEAAQLRLSRPAGAGGQTLTVDRTSLSVTPGLRATDALLEVSIRTSRGMQHPVVLPPGAELLGAMVGGQAQPLRIENGRVMLPLAPGASQVLLHWREPRGLGTLFRPEAVNVGAASVNADTDVHLPADRWVLLTGGPLVGPSVLFWSLLVVTLLVAAALGRVKLAPLGTAGWMLLGVGLTQVPVWAGAVVVACLLAFGWRAGKGASLRPDVAFNGMQIVLAGLAVISLMILFAAVRQGLLGAPDMQVQGNASTAVHLRWYQDRTSGELPRPWLLSVPLLVYRLAMLAWALWLVTALLRWLRWGASAATAGGLWRRMRMPRQAPKAPPTAPPA
ncbi:MAG TPA: hypothetical protein VK454_13430, partial [Myxococcaceae bacterium]|nr:hypothetical protein [Myxococcaceae bacterium]